MQSIEKKQQFLKNLPGLNLLSPEEISKLSDLGEEVHLERGALVLQEVAGVHYFYLIMVGNAEVFVREDGQDVPVEMLGPNATIGSISEKNQQENFMDAFLIRAETDLELLRFETAALEKILQSFPTYKQTIKSFHNIMEKLDFIRRASSFSKIDFATQLQIAKSIETLSVKQGEVIIQEGEVGDECYLLYSGEVSVSIQTPEGQKHLATLKRGALMGESAILSEVKRNATVTAYTDCELYSLSRQQIEAFILTNKEAEAAIIYLSRHRTRPLKRENITAVTTSTSDSLDEVIVRNPEHNRYMKLSPGAYDLLEKMNGQNSLHELTLEFFKIQKVFAPDKVATLIFELEKNGFLEKLDYDYRSSQIPGWIKLGHKLTTVLEYSYPFANANGFMQKLYGFVGKYIYNWFSYSVMLAIMVIGFFVFFELSSKAMSYFTSHAVSYWLFLLLIPMRLINIGLHELAHGLTTTHFKKEVRAFGLGWYFLSPIAFCDTSDMWLAKPQQRVLVNSAGIIVDLTLAGVIVFIAVMATNPSIIALLWLYALGSYLGAFFNLNPIVELDGYYILEDSLATHNLREEAFLFLTSLGKKMKYQRRYFVYWLTALFYLAIAISLGLWVQTNIFAPIFPDLFHENSGIVRHGLLPILILILSLLTLFVKSKMDSSHR